MHITITYQEALGVFLAAIGLTCWLSSKRYGIAVVVGFLLVILALVAFGVLR